MSCFINDQRTDQAWYSTDVYKGNELVFGAALTASPDAPRSRYLLDRFAFLNIFAAA